MFVAWPRRIAADRGGRTAFETKHNGGATGKMARNVTD
jgi:hypothetical protein